MINWKNEFTKEIPKLTRGVDLMIPEKKLGYAHCLSSSEVYSIIKHLPYDKKFTVFPNNLFIRRWNSSYNKNVDIINPNRYPHFEIDEETTLFARLSKMLQRISYEVSDEAERVLLSDIATKNVSSNAARIAPLNGCIIPFAILSNTEKHQSKDNTDDIFLFCIIFSFDFPHLLIKFHTQ